MSRDLSFIVSPLEAMVWFTKVEDSTSLEHTLPCTTTKVLASASLATGKVMCFALITANQPIDFNNIFWVIFVSVDLPSPDMLDATQKLIAYAIDAGHLSANYTLLGHRQTRSTECPGERLFNEITNWPHFGANVPVVP